MVKVCGYSNKKCSLNPLDEIKKVGDAERASRSTQVTKTTNTHSTITHTKITRSKKLNSSSTTSKYSSSNDSNSSSSSSGSSSSIKSSGKSNQKKKETILKILKDQEGIQKTTMFQLKGVIIKNQRKTVVKKHHWLILMELQL